MPATGFAMGIGRVLAALQKAGAWQQQGRWTCSSARDAGCTGRALALAAQLRGQGRIAVVSFAQTREETVQEAAAGGRPNRRSGFPLRANRAGIRGEDAAWK